MKSIKPFNSHIAFTCGCWLHRNVGLKVFREDWRARDFIIIDMQKFGIACIVLHFFFFRIGCGKKALFCILGEKTFFPLSCV